MALLELEGGLTNIKNADLNKMYTENENFDDSRKEAKRIKKTLDCLLKIFPEKTPQLERFSVISLYIIISQLLDGYIISERLEELRSWFIDFETDRQYKQKNVPPEKQDTEAITYQEKTSHSTDAKESIEWRHKFLAEKLFEAIPRYRTQG